ncbi:MAG: DUF1036 domain-containing protein [Pseudomonadota bacterium]
MPRLTLISAALTCLAAPALAGLEVCNSTDEEQSVAIGHLVDGTWTSEGWWNIAAQDCADVLSEPLQNRYYYYRAEIPGGVFEGEGYTFCIIDDVFTIPGQDDCEARGYQSAAFSVIDTGETATEFQLTLVAPEDLDEEPAIAEQSPEPAPSKAPVTNEVAPRAENGNTRLDSGFLLGSLGEPVTQIALFQGCQHQFGESVCAFFADGVKWVAPYGGPTPSTFLDQLNGLAQATVVELEGDILNYGDITIEVALSAVTLRPGALPYGREVALLQGAWVSEDDPAYEIEFAGGELYERYDGTQTDLFYWRFDETCEGARAASDLALIKTVPETRETECLLADQMSLDRLEFVNPGRGNILSFRRP